LAEVSTLNGITEHTM